MLLLMNATTDKSCTVRLDIHNLLSIKNKPSKMTCDYLSRILTKAVNHSLANFYCLTFFSLHLLMHFHGNKVIVSSPLLVFCLCLFVYAYLFMPICLCLFVYAYLFMQISTLLILNKSLCIKRRRKQNDIMTQLFIDHNQSITVIKY